MANGRRCSPVIVNRFPNLQRQALIKIQTRPQIVARVFTESTPALIQEICKDPIANECFAKELDANKMLFGTLEAAAACEKNICSINIYKYSSVETM
jgi:hypothetical protein